LKEEKEIAGTRNLFFLPWSSANATAGDFSSELR
jgi:hypothetical protein